MGIFKKRSIASLGKKKSDMPEGLWNKCPSCGAIIDEITLKQRNRVCTKCDHHFTLTSQERVAMLLDPDSFEEMDATIESSDALGFKGYSDKVKGYQKKTGLKDAVLSGRGSILGHPVTLGVMDFRFLGASMGSAAGEKLTRAIEAATAERRASIIVCASGGARMHEGILSLMQMAKTSGALARHHAAGLPYISILTHPTTGGVTASFATLGDIIMAEPNCMIGFAGPRVIKETTHQNLPPGFQTAEFLLDHGLVDMIVPRSVMRERIGQLLEFMLPRR
ncbi:MAG: acetyl-CoA carboxylase, carboxyltransferase subunit beta [Verrucomicrobiales bacterium]|jgi:acetyl-CoA carboxylase carboxyl transferase subunit beta|nr:acetyl-CoA carboxylase, carboxyltransferase subunit beta [Verrucomicrobiales bacterium]MDP4638461.1 acetyl-CoA carboxylase, carboxyltransferase subunit beta [Verrucomicrobiales bacterium]MDP4791789.1 acetyl-CoA carboxylase, carboxyltransferase subunit beta [Verrucomicrobiales bacterium]MDP4849414.1 acetyl-CoA carboxylase, carboxyltransferase subunit beta [Verrucomicrobiales bacterium]MDP4939926.1 acetyl-CoA carboxylase, carboxyltransferase subunit beta [Verrucomicrobiales bacterium]